MKVTDIKVYAVEAVRRNWTFIEVETDAGITGLGEITLEMFDTGVAAAVEDYKRLLIGENPLEIERLYDHLVRNKFWRTDTLSTTVLSGIDIALWDIKGKELGVPVYRLLGGPVRDTVRAYGNYWFLGATKDDYARTVDDYARAAARAVDEGWDALKWSPFGSSAYTATIDEERVIIECVKRVREAVGDRADLLLDAHGRFNLPTIKRISRKLEPYEPFFIEEPIPPENVEAMVELKRSTRVPLATGERLITKHQFRDLLNSFAVDYIQPDIIHTGGITEMKKIAALAEAFYIPLIPHNPNGPVATAATIHLATSIPNFMLTEYIDLPERADVLVEPLVVKNGQFALPTKPGLGIELNKKVFKNYPPQEREWDHYSPVRNIRMS
ncbi:MAG: galactonate dehydratase [Alphaproteobacteria bacterium]|nr:galactonate dehydratase [Alphaproteobacteria bacterium]MCY4499649.1 galactonate dehydratase [Rhodospirillaceae bacterium]